MQITRDDEGTHHGGYSFEAISRWTTRWCKHLPDKTPISFSKLVIPITRDDNHWVCIVVNTPNHTLSSSAK